MEGIQYGSITERPSKISRSEESEEIAKHVKEWISKGNKPQQIAPDGVPIRLKDEKWLASMMSTGLYSRKNALKIAKENGLSMAKALVIRQGKKDTLQAEKIARKNGRLKR